MRSDDHFSPSLRRKSIVICEKPVPGRIGRELSGAAVAVFAVGDITVGDSIVTGDAVAVAGDAALAGATISDADNAIAGAGDVASGACDAAAACGDTADAIGDATAVASEAVSAAGAV